MKSLRLVTFLVFAVCAFCLTAVAQTTIEIDIMNKQYVPPKRTPKIPPEFKEQNVRFAVRAGETIKICNKDIVRAKPFSFSKENRFEGLAGPGGLRQGRCISYVVKNPGGTAIRFNLTDEINSWRKLFLVVLPANYPNEGEEDTPPAAPIPPMRSLTELQEQLVGRWKSPAKVTIVLNEDGTGSWVDERGGPAGSMAASGTFSGFWTTDDIADKVYLSLSVEKYGRRGGTVVFSLSDGKLHDPWGSVYTRQ